MSVAQLSMYDLPEIRAAADALWQGIATRLGEAGIADVPPRLSRDFTHHEGWRRPDLLFSQACGYPALREFRGALRIIAKPIYAVPGCEGATHTSFIIVPAGSPARDVADLRNARFALNSFDSNSGMNLPRLAFAPLAERGRFLGAIVETGAHAMSLAAVAEGRADAAAIDCVTHALVARHRPALVARTRILAWTQPSPALPYVAARTASEAMVAALREALLGATADPALASARRELFLEGAMPAEETDYAVVADYEERARALGYPELR